MYHSFWGYSRKLKRMAWDLFCPQSSELVIAGAKEECQWSPRFQVRRFDVQLSSCLVDGVRMRGQPPLHLLSWKRILGLHLFELHVLNYNFTVIRLSFKKNWLQLQSELNRHLFLFFLRNSWCPQDGSCKIKVFLPCVLLLFERSNVTTKTEGPERPPRAGAGPNPNRVRPSLRPIEVEDSELSGSGLPWNESHTIHSHGIYTYISYKKSTKCRYIYIYTIHGWYGNTTNTPVYTWKIWRA